MADEFKGKNIITEVDVVDASIPLTDETKMYIDTEYAFRQINLIRLFDWIKGKMTLAVYPVGSVYMTFSEDNPANTFGGTWEKIESRFLLGSGEEYSIGDNGGESTVTLTTDEMPIHGHSGTATAAGDHTHPVACGNAGNHSHSITVNSGGSHSHSGSVGAAGEHDHFPWDTDKRFALHSTLDTAEVDRRGVQAGTNYWAVTSTNITMLTQSHTTSVGGRHSHSVSIGSGGGHSHSASSNTTGSHSHSISVNSSGSHNHSVVVNASGNGQAHNNMPPYTVVNIWRRVS